MASHYNARSAGSHRGSPQRGAGRERWRGTEGLADLVAKAVKQANVGGNSKLGQLQKAWLEAVGRQYAEQSRVCALKGSVLVVEVRSAALGQELSVYHKRMLLKRLEEQTGIKLADLRCKLSGRPQGD